MSVERSTEARLEPQQLLGADLGAVAEEARPPERQIRVPLNAIDRAVEPLLRAGGRLVLLTATEQPEPSLLVTLALRAELVTLRAPFEGGRAYPAVARLTAAAAWPERELHDLTGIVPLDHPQLDPIIRPDPDKIIRQVGGPETFVIPYGPIRSGVFESIQYVIDTGGEDVLAISVRPFFKHRGLEAMFASLGFEHGAFLAERIAGPAAVAHAIAFAEAVERASGSEPPARALRWRVVHAELERIASHLDVATRLAEDAALAVGVARFGILKEDVMRLRARLCGSRFGRGVVTPGGIAGEPMLAASELMRAIDRFERDYTRDRRLLLRTTSFTDRLIGSGTLDRETVDAWGGVGPVARACSIGIDARFERPAGAYRRLGFRIASASSGDAMARLEVRFQEIDQSLHLIRQAMERLERLPETLLAEVEGQAGFGFGWAEAPMGEVAYRVAVADRVVREVRIASPSLRNWPLFAASFRGDVLTDFSFIEHSFGLTPAGADR